LASSRSAVEHGDTRRAAVNESPLAKSVTSWPRLTSRSVRFETTRSVPPYSLGGTLSKRGAICAIRKAGSLPLVFRRFVSLTTRPFSYSYLYYFRADWPSEPYGIVRIKLKRASNHICFSIRARDSCSTAETAKLDYASQTEVRSRLQRIKGSTDIGESVTQPCASHIPAPAALFLSSLIPQRRYCGRAPRA
jgi:hypothetical protein